MREIKFRAKRLDNGEWVDGFVLFNHDKSEAVIAKLTDTESACENVVPDTVCQFTGLLDKNGKEIYEGDILRDFEYPFYNAQADAYNYYAIVDWDADAAQFYAYKDLAREAQVRGVSCGVGVDMEDLRDMEVIGNIYDNLGLLKS